MAEYKIKDLEQLTGIKAHTIRMWEKRYGILNPERTETQIRTYCDEELVTLLNVALLNKNGIKISRIAEMNPSEIAEKVLGLRSSYDIDSSYEKLVLALIELDEFLFKSVLNELVSQKGLEQTFVSYLLPFLEKIGVMWLVGSINAAQEHFMSNLIRQSIISEIEKLPVPTATDQPIMLFLPEHEWHEISLLFYHYILRKEGRFTFYLGQSLPYDALLECIEKVQPTCLITSWLTSVDEGFLKRYFQRLAEDTNRLTIYAGGYQIKVHEAIVSDWVIPVETIETIKQIKSAN
jgi:DNA-binding transcriptional MerR regulator